MKGLHKTLTDFLLPIGVGCVFMFLYIPIMVMAIFSFNSVEFPYRWVSFSTRWYLELWESTEIWEALYNSLTVACSVVVLSLTLGVLFIYYAAQYFDLKKLDRIMSLFYGNLMMPEIVLAVGLLSFFVLFDIPLGMTTLIAGHTVIGFGYVMPLVYARFREMDYSVIEASLDLGASIHQTFLRVILPLMRPALAASALLIFIISFDDFLISFFCTGTTAQTLPVYIFSMIHAGVSPAINALSTLLLMFSTLLVMIYFSMSARARIF
jgi:spermidine/putrescine transport system permease protein